MDIRQLRYFLGVIEAKSLTQAAGPLRVAQPALGLQIRNLERELGVKLLLRHARGVVPTEAGLLLARHAERLLRQFNQARQDVMDYGKVPRGRIKLGLTSTAAQVLAVALVERCRRKFPEIRLVLSEGRSRELTEMVAGEEVDLALGYDPGAAAELASRPLVEESLMLVSGAGGQKLKREITRREVLKQDLILPSRPQLVREMLEAAASALDTELRLYCEVDAVATMKELARRGLAATVLPLGVVHEEVEKGELRAQRIVDAPLTRTLYLVSSARRPPSKALDSVLGEVEALARSLAQRGITGWRPV
jgi:LysR family nitrogen assimilation transcriptional regulator